MKTTISALALLLLATACSSSSVATRPLDGGTTTDGGGSEACAAGSPTATFQLNVVGEKRFCDSSGCDGSFLEIRRPDGTPLAITSKCLTTCAKCQEFSCPAACRVPGFIPATGTTQAWQGTVQEISTCGQNTQCENARCVAPGTYVAHMCGFAELEGGGAGTGQCEASQTPTCTDVTFTWPPSGTIAGTIGTP